MIIQGYRESKIHLAEFLNLYFNGSKPSSCLWVDNEPVLLLNINSIPKNFDKEAFIKEFMSSLARSPILVNSPIDEDSEVGIIEVNPIVRGGIGINSLGD